MISCRYLFASASLAAPWFLTGMQGAVAAPLVATNVAGVFTIEAPPAGFDMLHASAADLRRYGLPPRPDALRVGTAYEAWAHLAAGARNFIQPVLRQAATRHLPRMPAPGPRSADAADTVKNSPNSYNSNWSGIADVSTVGSFGANSVYVMFGEWVVPIAQQAFGVCSGTDYSATWMGIDGFTNKDVFQGGTESDASCSGGATYGNYYAWFEWYPGNTYEISNFPVAPGDDVAAELIALSSTNGLFYITNETTNEYTVVNFSAPAGTYLAGNSCEWIVERPSINNVLPTLTNYVSDFMTNTIAELYNGSAVFGGTGTALFPRYYVTMVDSANNPISGPFAVGSASLAFHDSGEVR